MAERMAAVRGLCWLSAESYRFDFFGAGVMVSYRWVAADTVVSPRQIDKIRIALMLVQWRVQLPEDLVEFFGGVKLQGDGSVSFGGLVQVYPRAEMLG